MKVLVTGSRGFLGRRLISRLLGKFDVVQEADLGLYDPGWPHHDDVRTLKVGPDIDLVIHLAAIVGEPACQTYPDLARSINVDGTINIVEQCRKRDVPLIFASTCSVYGAADHVLFEDSATKPIGPYAHQRLEAEAWVLKNNGVALRFGTLFGWSERMRFDLVINAWLGKVLTHEPIVVNGGMQWRPFTEVNNAAEAVIKAVDLEPGIYNVCGVNMAIIELAQRFKNLFDCKVIIEDQTVDQRDYRVSSEKLIRQGWEPNQELNTALRQTRERLQNNCEIDPAKAIFHNVQALKSHFLKPTDIH